MNPPKMPIHIGDYQRDTGHLRAIEHGAYLLLMFHYWSTGGLPDNDEHLAAIARLSRTEWNKHKATLQAFFEDGWKHGRIDFDLGKARGISDAAREAGKESGRSRAIKRSLNGRSRSVEPTLEPSTLSKKEDTASAVPKYVFEDGVIRLIRRDFEAWQEAYSYLDLRAELLSLSKWASEQGEKWFHALKGALAKRNREVKAERDRLAKEGGFKWQGGMEGVV